MQNSIEKTARHFSWCGVHWPTAIDNRDMAANSLSAKEGPLHPSNNYTSIAAFLCDSAHTPGHESVSPKIHFASFSLTKEHPWRVLVRMTT
jgi:hypothetical protein